MRLERGALRSERLAGCREARAVDRAHFEWAYRHDKRAEPRLPRLTAPAYWKFESISLQERVSELSVPGRRIRGDNWRPPPMLVYPIAETYVDHVVLVPDDEIKRAQQVLWEILRVVAESGGAAAFAALLSGRYQPQSGEHVGILLSGGNTTAVNFG
jgi:hypothetical protein